MNDAPLNAIRSYRPGGWFAIFGDHASVLLPESEKSRVASLWELVDAGAGFDELLDALIATGLRSLPGFVLVSTAEEPTRLVLRGAARAVVTLEGGETVDVDGGAAATWVEQALSGVSALRLVLEDDADEVDFGIRGGLVRASRVDQPPYVDSGRSSEFSGRSSGVGAPVPVSFDPLTDDLPADAVAREPLVEEPAVQPSVDQEPADVPAASPAVEVPVGNEPVDVSAAEEPFAQESAEVPAVDEPVAQSADELAAVDEPVADEPVAEQPAVGTGEVAVHEPGADVRTEAHAFPFFNDPEPEDAEQPVAEQPAPEQPVAEPTEQPAAEAGEPAAEPAAEPPSEPVWGQPQQGNVYSPPEAPANPFAAGADNPADPPMWEPPAPAPAPHWGAPAPAQPEAPAPGQQQAPDAQAWEAEQDPDHDGNTFSGGYSADQFARQHPGIPGQPQAPSVTAQPVARLVFSSGETIDVDRAVLVGRAPEARRFTSTDQPRLVTVSSPNQEISSTHLEVRPGSGVDHGSAIVTDMGSTNGTVLTQPGFAPEDLQPGIAVQLLPGSVIDLGDGVTIQITSL